MPRPTTYNPELAQLICNTIANSASGLVAVNKNEELPEYSTILQWLTDPEKKEFQQSYQRAREAQADLIIDEMIDIADEPLNEKTSSTQLSQIKLRIETRQWKAARLAPNKYGAKPETTGTDTGLAIYTGSIIKWGEYLLPV